ncbi:OB-fold domain-containing protein [Streptosporangiaceae bacterium NEAU-GS5]|nr:OB-fold domain-containing protein [Streptosporangiaceae bacterium NEAU-GS5]
MTPDASWDAYWTACRRGELVVQACTACARRVHPPAEQCPDCGSADLVFAPVSGKGVVHTFTVVHRTRGGRQPYAVGWVDLDEGVRAFGELLTAEPRIGMPVEVAFVDDLPCWRGL